MPLNITKASDAIEVKTTNVVIYGQPGAGKTSILGTCEAPLLLDFDRGAHRSAFRPDAVRIESWGDITSLTREDLAGYKTLGLDTAGRALDFLAAAMPFSEGKTQLKRPSGGLTLQGYGRLKDDFISWMRQINTMGLDIVLIAHDREDKDGDLRFFRPDIMGGSYGEIVKSADFVGYLGKTDGDKTVLNFSPNAAWIGKNSAGFPPLYVPNFAIEPQWFAGILTQMKAALGGVAERQKAAVNALTEFKAKVDEAQDLEGLNALIAAAQALGRPLSLQAWNYLKKEAADAGFGYDKEAKAFIEAPAQEPGQEQAA